MVLPQNRWEQVGRWFNEDEKLEIGKAETGESALQRGKIIDERQLSAELREKLKLYFTDDKKRARAVGERHDR